MMKEIGSIFPLYSTDCMTSSNIISIQEEGSLFSLAREALLYLAQKIETANKKVMLPAYTCQTVIDPFLQENWKPFYYKIKTDLHIDANGFRAIFQEINPSVIVFHPYCGMELLEEEEEVLEEAHRAGAIIIEDMTQIVFANRDKNYVDYYLGSLRKWFNIPDGAFLYSNFHQLSLDEINLRENESFVQFQKDAMYLRGDYFQNKDPEVKQISIRLNKHAVGLIGGQHIELHRMAEFSKCMMIQNDFQENQDKRYRNYEFLHNNLKRKSSYKLVNPHLSKLCSAPLYFPIYAEDRKTTQKLLANNSIYAPVLWPVNTTEVIVSEDVQYIYEHILMIPIDQRYEIEDMQRIIDVLDN